VTYPLTPLRRAELDALVQRSGDSVTPAAIVEFASDPATALHGLFEWDDEKAGPKYREQQAQAYLRLVVRVIPVDGQDRAVRAYVSLSSDRGTNIYRPILTVLSDQTKRAELVEDALRGLQALRTKYGHLQELAQVWNAAESLGRLAA